MLARIYEQGAKDKTQTINITKILINNNNIKIYFGITYTS